MKDGWYSRPVLFVESVERAIAFYRDQLGFVEGQRYEEEGTVLLGEVTRGDCTLLLNCQQPDKIGRGRMFISLTPGLIEDLRAEFERRGAPIRDGCGVAVFAASIRNFFSAGTPVQGTRPTQTLVTTGIYGWSRNPIYLGMLFFLVGIGIAIRSPWILLLAVPLAITFRYGVIAREEAYLERRFGDAYRDYKAHVRRWL